MTETGKMTTEFSKYRLVRDGSASGFLVMVQHILGITAMCVVLRNVDKHEVSKYV
jgi:hypothetical protein